MGKYTDFYRKRHETGYGRTGHKHLKTVADQIKGYGVKTVLDWGAGSRTLGKALSAATDWMVYSYDPYVPAISAHPLLSYDAVITTDVLEHLPYEAVDSAVEELVGLTNKVGYHFIANFPARDTFPDGTNIHIVQEDAAWWRAKFEAQGVKVTEATDVCNVALNPITKRDQVVYKAARIIFRK